MGACRVPMHFLVIPFLYPSSWHSNLDWVTVRLNMVIRRVEWETEDKGREEYFVLQQAPLVSECEATT